MKTGEIVIGGGLLAVALAMGKADGETVSEKAQNVMSGFASAFPSSPNFIIDGVKDKMQYITLNIKTAMPDIPDVSGGFSNPFKIPSIKDINPFKIPSITDILPSSGLNKAGGGSFTQNYNNTLNTAKVIAGAYVGGKGLGALSSLARRKTTKTIITKTAQAVVSKGAKKTALRTVARGGLKILNPIAKGVFVGSAVGNVAVGGLANVQKKYGWKKWKSPLPRSVDKAIRSYANIFKWGR